jgi:hypothetical protein
MVPFVPSLIVAFSDSAGCAASKTLEIVFVLSTIFSNAALVVFAIYMKDYVDRRDVAVAQSVIHLKNRMVAGEDKLVETLEKIAERMK